jgi:hypothetical protein
MTAPRLVAARWPRACAFAPALLVLVPFYVWTGGSALNARGAEYGAYDVQAQALAQGQLHLPVSPNPRLFELSDPYYAGRNAFVRLGDASLYRGRYYLYFGLTPALLAFLPWRHLGLGPLPASAAAIAFGTGHLLFSGLLLLRLLDRHAPQVSCARRTILLVVLGLSNVVPFILREPDVYEVAVAAGACLTSGAAWLFLVAGETGSRVRLALGSLLLGLAVGARPNLLLLTPLLPLLAWPPAPDGRAARRLVSLSLAAGPVLLCLLLLGLANHARFGSSLEFGARYQLVGVTPPPWYDHRSVVPALWIQFLSPPELGPDFPFVRPNAQWNGPLPVGFFLDHWTTGVLAHSPYAWILLATPWIVRAAREPRLLRRRLALLVLGALALPAVTTFTFGAVAMRYQVDFVSLLLVPSLVLCALAPRALPRWPQRLWVLVGALAFGWAAAVGFALSLHGVSRGSRPGHTVADAGPATTTSRSWVAPLCAGADDPTGFRARLCRLLDPDGRLVRRLRVAFAETSAADREPLLSWGEPRAFDVVWVRQPSPGSVSLELQTAAGDRAVAEGLRFEPGRFSELAFDIDRFSGVVTVSEASRPIARLSGRLVPLRASRIWDSRGPRGNGAPYLGRFSGTVINEAMLDAAPPGLEGLSVLSLRPALVTRTTASPPVGPEAGQIWVPLDRRGAYAWMGDGWRWIPRHYLDRVQCELDLTLGSAAPGTMETLFSWGEQRTRTALVLRYAAPDTIAVAFAQGSPESGWRVLGEGPPLALPPPPARASILLDRVAGRVRVGLSGTSGLDLEVPLPAIALTSVLLGSSAVPAD